MIVCLPPSCFYPFSSSWAFSFLLTGWILSAGWAPSLPFLTFPWDVMGKTWRNCPRLWPFHTRTPSGRCLSAVTLEPCLCPLIIVVYFFFCQLFFYTSILT